MKMSLLEYSYRSGLRAQNDKGYVFFVNDLYNK